MSTIIEGGHFYSSHGLGIKSGEGWDIAKNLKGKLDKTLLFIDDIHQNNIFENADVVIPVDIDINGLNLDISNLAKEIIIEINRNSKVNTDQESKVIKPNYLVLESEMKVYTDRVIEVLMGLSRKKRAKNRDGHGTFCSNKKLLDNDGNPTCIGYDLGLTLLKDELGFNNAINVLPRSYDEQQSSVARIYQKINSEFNLQQKYF